MQISQRTTNLYCFISYLLGKNSKRDKRNFCLVFYGSLLLNLEAKRLSFARNISTYKITKK